MKLSIIVPIYNVAPYLRKCVDSLLAQDITDYEIILVDDGSPDECPQICDGYAEKYDNIRVVHQENAGLSAARNSGIKVATGDYIMYVHFIALQREEIQLHPPEHGHKLP